MKVAHLCLSCFYIDGYAYQENQLVAEHVRLGHDVHVIASTESYDNNAQLVYVSSGAYNGTDGAKVIRIPYRFNVLPRLARKIRAYVGLDALLRELQPEVILFHGLASWELLTVAAYVKRNPGVKLFADSHEDWNNSARSILSKWVLHYGFYRVILQRSLPLIQKVLCVSLETIDFVRELYGVPQDQIEFYPLGGLLWDDFAYEATRARTRETQGWSSSHRVFLQSGKIDGAKRLGETLRAFKSLADPNLRLVIAGQIMADVRDDVLPLIDADPRVQMLGWVDPQQLRALLCAVDVYVQPGSQSATMQMALCCRRPLIIADVPSHRVFMEGNGLLVQSDEQLAKALTTLAQVPDELLTDMSRRSAAVATRLLDYRQQAMRVLEPS